MNVWEFLTKNPEFAGGVIVTACLLIVATATVLCKFAEAWGIQRRQK